MLHENCSRYKKRKEYMKKYMEEHKEERAKYNKQYFQDNKDRCNELARKSYHNGGKITKRNYYHNNIDKKARKS